MKKLAIILTFLMLVPGAAFGLEMMNDGAMDDVTGQAGVSIAFDDVQIFMHIDRMTWIDSDGFDTDRLGNEVFGNATTTTGDPGALGIENFQLDVLEVNAITGSDSDGAMNLSSVGDLDLNFTYESTATLANATIDSSYGSATSNNTMGLDNYNPDANQGDSDIEHSALTIDATSDLPAITTGIASNHAALSGQPFSAGGVMIGLPTAEFYIPSLTFTPAFYNVEGATDEAVNDVNGADLSSAGVANDALPAADFGTINMEGIYFTTLGGWVEIAPH